MVANSWERLALRIKQRHGDHRTIHQAAVGKEQKEQQKRTKRVEPNLPQKVRKFAEAVSGIDHIVTGDQNKCTGTNIAAQPDQLNQGFVGGREERVAVKAVDGVMIGHDHQHAQNPQQFQLAVSLSGLCFFHGSLQVLFAKAPAEPAADGAVKGRVNPVNDLGHQQRGEQRNRNQHQNPEKPVFGLREKGHKNPVQNSVADPGEQVGGEGKLCHRVHQSFKQGGAAAEVQRIEEKEAQQGNNVDLIVVVVNAYIFEGRGLKVELIEAAEEKQRGKQRQAKNRAK